MSLNVLKLLCLYFRELQNSKEPTVDKVKALKKKQRAVVLKYQQEMSVLKRYIIFINLHTEIKNVIVVQKQILIIICTHFYFWDNQF